MIVPAVFFLAGIAATAALVAAMTRTADSEPVAGEETPGEVAILLWETIEGDAESELAGMGGGNHGISHASIDLGELDADGSELIVEAYPGEGVIRGRMDRHGERRHTAIILTGEDAAEVRGCVRAQIGRPFSPLGLFDGLANKDAMLCSTLVYRCLPSHLRAVVDEARPEGAVGAAVSPAQLALAFGATIGGAPVYVQ